MVNSEKIGLSLGGGGARGIGHVVVLEVIDQLGIKIDEITGSSIGSVFGMGYASGMAGRELRSSVLLAFDDRRKVIRKLWELRPSSLQDWFNPRSYSIGQLSPEYVLSAFTPINEFPENIENLDKPLTVIATDYYAGEPVAYRTGNLKKAVAASISIPMLFKPVQIDERILIDGNISNPLPFDQFVGKMDKIIAVDVVGGPDPNGKKVPAGFECMLGANQILMQAITRQKLSNNPPNVLVRPPINQFRVLDFLKASTILRVCDAQRDVIKQKIERVLLT